jgi:hypothetical protein
LKSDELLFVGIVGFVGWTFYSKARAASTLIVLPGNVSNLGFDGATPYIDLTLRLQNTSSSGFTVESLAGQLTCNDTYIGNISTFTPVHINANSEQLLPVRARLMLLGLVNEIVEAFNGSGFEKLIRIDGFVNAGFVRAPLHVEFKIGG